MEETGRGVLFGFRFGELPYRSLRMRFETVETESYQSALKNDTMGNPDDFFTITRLLWAKQSKSWYLNLKSYVKPFAGLVES